MSDDYQRRSYGEISVGLGQKPGIVVVDFQLGFTEASYPLGGAPLVMRAVENTARLLEVARRHNVPVAVCNTSYLNEREMPYWKITAVRETFLHDHPSTRLDPRIHDPAYDLTVTKKGPSIFFETGVANYFTKERVDTVIVTGCNTSGCIRATAIDSFAYRYRTLVPEDCVGDIEEQPHRDNLRDIGRRYVDVTDAQTCIAFIKRWAARNRPEWEHRTPGHGRTLWEGREETHSMRYEVRVNSGSIGAYDTPEEALDRVRTALAENPNDEPEIIDMETGQAFEPAATVEDREDLANKVGY